jgi:hypothetical protein
MSVHPDEPERQAMTRHTLNLILSRILAALLILWVAIVASQRLFPDFAPEHVVLALLWLGAGFVLFWLSGLKSVSWNRD